MKKTIAIFLTTVFLIIMSVPVSASAAETDKGFSAVMAINEEVAVVNDTRSLITAPVLVFGRTYVDLYAVAPILGIGVQWVPAYVGYFSVSANDMTFDFTLISQWDDLINQKHKFFVKDSKIYVSLRELNELSGYDISYADGVITIGERSDFASGIYGDIDLCSMDDYVYTAYPVYAEYVINPYQPYGYETMLDDVKKLQHMYPELINTSAIGKSVEGRDLLMIEFGRGSEKVFVCGTHHAREYITTTYLMYAIDRYAYAYRHSDMWGGYNPREILDNITFCIVPMVNPDGVNLVQNGLYATANPEEIAAMGIYEGRKYGYSAWKANVHGVDLNWNYNKDWSPEKSRNPRGSVGFNGDYPGSEPETLAVSTYVDNNPFSAYVSFHTQGEIFYWADNPENPTDINEIIKKETGFVEYRDDGTGIGGSFFDYAYRNFNKPTLTVELCPYIGNFPYPDKDFDTVWKPTKNVLLIVGDRLMRNK